MSNIYIQEPPTTGKVLMKTSVGDIDIELWTREAPKACRNFIQLCMEGYYNNTIFHRVVKGFIVQGGDPTGTGQGGESIYGAPFKDEFHTRLRFCRRGLVAMANAGKDDNSSQFFFTFAATPELQNKHTIFGKIAGETIYNMLKLEDAIVDDNERPQYPQKIIKTEVLLNPFSDIVPRVDPKDRADKKEKKKEKKSGVKNFKLLSFGEEAEVDEEESTDQSKKLSGKSKSAHDNLQDPKLSSVPAIVENSGPPSKKRREDRSSDWESDGEDLDEEEVARIKKEKAEMKLRIMDKLKEKKSDSKKVKEPEYQEDKSEEEEEEYYFGKDRDDERKRKVEEARRQLKELKRADLKERRAREEEGRKKKEEEKKGEEKKKVIQDFLGDQEKYKAAKAKLPKKGEDRDRLAVSLLEKFKSKLKSKSGETPSESSKVEKNDDSDNDDSWITHKFACEEKDPVLAKDASTKDDDWFEIYDPRNPLNKRRRGETSSRKTKSGR